MATTPTSSLGVQNWYQDTLSSAITSTDTTIPITNLPSPTEGYLIIDPDNTSNREVIHYTSKTGSAVVLPGTGDRGLDGTAAIAHNSGTTVRMDFTTSHFTALQNLYALPNGSITVSQINFGGSGSGIWWQEIARVSLGATAATMSTGAFTAKKYLHYQILGLSSATLTFNMHFNSDGATNYANRASDNGSADASAASTGSVSLLNGGSTGNGFAVGDIFNSTAFEKLIYNHGMIALGVGAANVPGRRESAIKWANTAAQITNVDVTNTGAAVFNPNSEIVILGHD